MLFTDLMREWGLVEFDFRRSLGLSLRAERNRMTWREFTVLVAGLLATETLLNARFHPQREQPVDTAGSAARQTYDD